MRSRTPRVLLLLSLLSPAPLFSAQEAPTAKQLQAAQEAFKKFGAAYKAVTDPRTGIVTHTFRMPRSTRDAELKNLPNPPFCFALSLWDAQVTDAGLKELKGLKNLTSLSLSGTQVTDAGLKQLREALPRCEVHR